MTALDQHALDNAITEFVRVFQPPCLTGDPETDRDDYASAVGEAVESAIDAYLQQTAAHVDRPDFPEGIDYDRWTHVVRPSPREAFAEFLEPDDELAPTGRVLHVRPWNER